MYIFQVLPKLPLPPLFGPVEPLFRKAKNTDLNDILRLKLQMMTLEKVLP